MPRDYSKLTPGQLQQLLDKIRSEKLRDERRWEHEATNKQLPPDHPRHHKPYTDPDGSERACGCTGVSKDWVYWVFVAGRGYGKTQSGAKWVVHMALTNPGCQIAVVAPTFQGVREVCFEGPSGIRKVLDRFAGGEERSYNKNNLKIELHNGSSIQGFSAENPDTIRGSNLTFAWLDELASYSDDKFYTEVLRPALRIKRADGGEPRVVITATPREGNKLMDFLIKQCRADPVHYHLTRAKTKEAHWLSEQAVKDMYAALSPEEILQELEAELGLESAMSFFKRRDFDRFRVTESEIPQLDEVMIGVDPAMTTNARSDESGIVVVGKGQVNGEYHSYVLEDASGKYTPDGLTQIVQTMWFKHGASLVILEVNQGGDYVPDAIRSRDSSIDIFTVRAMKTKEIRALQIARLNEVGRIHMVGYHDELELQLARMRPEQDRKKLADDHADAFVWAMFQLVKGMDINWFQAYSFQPCSKCGVLVHKLKPHCPACGTEANWDRRDRYAERRNEEKAATRWWKGYLTQCDTCGGKYPISKDHCPECHIDPMAYMAQVARTMAPGASHEYSGKKNWFAGRKL